MTGGKIQVQIDYCNCCPDMLKIYQRQTKLLEFSRDTIREELKIRKKMTSLKNGFMLRF